MQRSRLFLAAWLLLLVPTLVIGWLALRSVREEGARIARAERTAAAERVASIAATLDLSVAEARQGLLQTLTGMVRGGVLEERLEDWRLGNPLVRNVFVWHPDRGLLHPPSSWPRGAEDRAFADRYAALFGGRVGWVPSPAERSVDAAQTPSSALSSLSGRRELRQLALQETKYPVDAPVATTAAVATTTGWIPWFAENRLHFLGWAEQPASGLRYGLEVELMALLSRLLPGFPTPAESGESYALLDGNGRVFHQTGGGDSDHGTHLAVPVGPELPHWQVSVSWVTKATAVGPGVALLSTLVVGSFVAAILLGGGLLLWQARRHWRDAHQKTTFVANVSHELKTPLTTIRMYAELLAEDRIRDAAKRRDYLGVIVTESQRLTRLVNNVLEFGRLEQGRKRYTREPIDLAALTRAVLDAMAPRFAETGIQLHTQPPPAGAVVYSDRDAIEQILLNLLDNSFKYASQGMDITVEISCTEDQVRVRVGDRGPGIPATHRQPVFDKFHRVEDSLTAAQPGSGLGLSIARQMARGLGGELVYRDRDGGGAWFELTLPVTEEDPR